MSLNKDILKAYRIANELGFEIKEQNKDGTFTVYPAKRKQKEIDNETIMNIVEIIRE